mmetsp:Transcript_33464/g.73406  ORF Transcript_33464/g.73406 Transcript_33464/m.73406 type:complete len:830 (+) Transcript_33464:265-2754(+)
MPRTQYHADISRDAWSERLAELRDFKAVHGHCNVPRGYADNPSLGRWVNKQRCHYKHMKQGKQCPMTPERSRTLEKEGFRWEIRNLGGRGKGLGSRSNLRIKITKPPSSSGTGRRDAAAAAASDDSDDEGHCSGCRGDRDEQAAVAGEPILLCDGCDREYHLGCVRPRLTEVPEGDFYCGKCDAAAAAAGSASKTPSKKTPKKGGGSSSKTKKAKSTSKSSVSPQSASVTSSSSIADSRDPNEGEEVVEEDEECCVCHGSRNDEAEAADEPVLLCDGFSCEREYHLRCVDPPIAKIPDGHFFCPNCAPVGTSAHLEAYLDQSEEKSADFPSSKQYVHYLLRTQMKASLAEEDAAEASKPMDEVLATEGRAPKRARKSPSALRSSASNDDEDELSNWPERERPPRSELSRASAFHAAVMGDTSSSDHAPNNAAAVISSSASVASLANDESKDIGTTIITPNNIKLRPDFFVGKPIQVYCPLDNSYHNGRIVRWRKSTRGYPEYYGNDEVASSEFLIRFPPGSNGRRKGLHRWIILEEHSVAVSLAIVYAQQKKSRGLAGWKPAQIMVRSSLELIPVRHLLVDNGEERGLACFFGEAAHAYLKLREETADLFSPKFAAQRGVLETKSAIAAEVGGGLSPTMSPAKPPTKFNIGSTHFAHKFADLPLLLAYLEHDEQQRVNEWGRMPLSDPFHERALTSLDEYALHPVTMRTCDQDMIQHKEAEEDAEEEKGACADLKVQNTSVVREEEEVSVCLQIERGIDRQWLSRLAKAENICIDQSLDVMEGVKVNPVTCMTSAMARLQEQRKRSLPDATTRSAIAMSPTTANRKSLG